MAWRWFRRLLRNKLNEFMGLNAELSLYSAVSQVDHQSENSASDTAPRNKTTPSVSDDPGRDARASQERTKSYVTCGLFEPRSS